MSEMKDGRWWEFGVQLVDGCTPVSPACKNCWSAAMTHRFRPGEFTNVVHGHFDGRLHMRRDRISKFDRITPAVFSVWNDLFHIGVPISFAGDVLRKMCLNQQHKYLILTKRPEQALRYIIILYDGKPLPDHIWIGTTVENANLLTRLEYLMRIPANTFVSFEPLLSDVGDISRWLPHTPGGCAHVSLKAVIAGGETGAGARPTHPDWFRSIRDQCAEAGVPFFLKSLDQGKGRLLNGRTHDELPW